MSLEDAVARHYAHGSLEETILKALAALGKDLASLSHADLAPVDEFHIGGRQATIDFAAQLGLRPGMRVLDIGCGLGGTSRYLAAEHGCRVTGIDLTADYVQVATQLSRRIGLADALTYRVASAVDLPFEPASFDAAVVLHVGMNVADKQRLCAEARRVLAPGGVLGIYDVLRTSDAPFLYPVPWSAEAATNHIAPAAVYREALTAAGFTLAHERSRRDFALAFFETLRARMAEGRPSPLGLGIVMGPTAPQKIQNMMRLLEDGVIAPTELVARIRSA